ncbi:MAG: hypothetical protein ABEJ92_00660 [Halobacteriales archaeon]
MTAYRFRVKFDPDPTALWRDVVIGEARTVDEFQTKINEAVGLDQGHLWFVGADESYWDSDVKFERPAAYEERGDDPFGYDETTYNAGETTMGELVQRLDLDERDRLCYLYDYGDEWRFYGILKAILDDEPGDKPPEVVGEKGDPVEQYTLMGPAGYGGTDPSSLPEPLDDIIPTGIVTPEALRALEDRDDVVHVLVLLSVRTADEPMAERFAIQLDDAGYLLELFPDGWEVVDEVEGADADEAELLADLVALVRDWHAEITEMVDAVSDVSVDDETGDAMNVELDAELERIGYDDL